MLVGAVSATPAFQKSHSRVKANITQTRKVYRVCCGEGSEENVQLDKKKERVIRERCLNRDLNGGDTFCDLPEEKHSR